jgi:hypothetical protein
MPTASRRCGPSVASPAQGGWRNDLHDIDEVIARLLAFQQHYEQIARPFEWRFTQNDLKALLDRIAAHEDALRALAA